MTELIQGTFLKRYKRFFADIKLPTGQVVVAHVPNTGSMKSCIEEGWNALLTFNNDPKRKLKYTLEYMKSPQGLIGVNTHSANKIVKAALQENKIQELMGYKNIQPETTHYESRFDFYLSEHSSQPNCFVEVKNVTLSLLTNEVTFPDAVSTRGQKHLKDLIKIKQSGKRSVLLFVVQREDAEKFKAFQNIDSIYCNLLKEAHTQGVEILCYKTKFNLPHNHLHQSLPIDWVQL